MGEVLKILGKGALTIVMLPFIAVYFVIILVVGLITHLVQEVNTIIHFFKGQKVDYKDDIQLKYEEICQKRKELSEKMMVSAQTESEVKNDVI